mmetsp:Transcript_25280/g.86717  ORF Transcript_25280/g.86717 Transcript_25280/m.86717 type:complete len:96 (+) Transcript_25280:39-326(+)
MASAGVSALEALMFAEPASAEPTKEEKRAAIMAKIAAAKAERLKPADGVMARMANFKDDLADPTSQFKYEGANQSDKVNGYRKQENFGATKFIKP